MSGLAREWTEDDVVLANRVVQAVVLAGGEIRGCLCLVRAVGLPFGRKARSRSMRKVQDVMPLAAKLAREQFPDRALVTGGDIYRLIDKTTAWSWKASLRRLRKVHTAHSRVIEEVLEDTGPSGVLRGTLMAQRDILNGEVIMRVLKDDDGDGNTPVPA